MPKLSPIKAERLIKILLKLGFEKIRQKGSHLFLKHPDGRTTIIPIHKGEEKGYHLLAYSDHGRGSGRPQRD